MSGRKPRNPQSYERDKAEDVGERVTSTGNQQPRSLSPTPVRARRVMRTTRAQGWQGRSENREGRTR